MIDLDDFMPIIIGFIAAGILFFGFMIYMTKTLRTPSTGHITTEHDRKLMEQKWRMDEIRSQQRQISRDQKSKMRETRNKIRDLQRR